MSDNSTYKIPEQNISKFQAKINLLNRKAKRLLGYEFEPVIFGYEMIEQPNGSVLKVYDVCLTGEVPKLNDWEFIAKLDHANETGNIVRAVPGKVVPEEYRNRGCICDHCNVNRYRRDTYLVRHEVTGEYKQVGSACLKDFFGHDHPEKIAKLAELLGFANEYASVATQLDVGTDYRYVSLVHYLDHVFRIIRHEGYVSSTQAKIDGINATSALACTNMFKTHDNVLGTPADMENAKAAIAWTLEMAKKSQLSDYEHNIVTIAKAEVIEFRSMNYAASIAGGYLRELNREAKNKVASTSPSQHIGQVGEKVTSQATITIIRSIDHAMTASTLYGLVDASGNELRWFASVDQEVRVGDQVTITGRIKKLDEYKGVKQTIITRCKMEKV